MDSLLQEIYAIEADTNFTVPNDSNSVAFLSWSQLYNFMNQAAVNSQQPPLPELEEVLEPYMQEGQFSWICSIIVLIPMQWTIICTEQACQHRCFGFTL